MNYFYLMLLDLEVSLWANKMVQQVDTLSVMPEHLSLIPGSHITEGKDQQAASDFHIPAAVHMPTHI